MDVICYCFQQHGSPGNSDNDEAQSEKWGLINQEISNANRRDTDDEKVKEYNMKMNNVFDIHSLTDDDQNNDDTDVDDQNESDAFTPQTPDTFNISDPLLEDTASNYDPHTTFPRLSTTISSTWDEPSCTASLVHNDSMYSNTSEMDGPCPNCIHLQHMQKQLDLQIQTIRERNNELEDKIVDAQTNEENTKRLYDELKEDLDVIHAKYEALLNTTQETKVSHDSALHEMRDKLENDLQNMEKGYQNMLRDKNALELTLTETKDKLNEKESDFMQLQNAFSTLEVQKCRVEEDLKTQEKKTQMMMEEEGEKRDTLDADVRELMETIKRQKHAAVTEKENNELTSNILKDQIKSLHGEIAELEEEKKALEESVALYEEQMNAAQLMDNASLHLIEEQESDDDDDNDASGIIIPEDEETEINVHNIGSVRRRSKSNNMSISELEPAIYRPVSFSAQNSDPLDENASDDDDDSVYVNYDIEPRNKFGPLLIRPNSGPLAPAHHTVNVPSYELEDAAAALPVIAELRKIRMPTRQTRSVSDVLKGSPLGCSPKKDKRSPSGSRHGYSASLTVASSSDLNVWRTRYSELKNENTSNAKQMAQKDIELSSLRDKLVSLEAIIAGDADKIECLCHDLRSQQECVVSLRANEVALKAAHQVEVNSLNRELNRLRDEVATLSAENSRYAEYKAKTTKEVKKKHKLHTKQLKFNEELMNEIFDLNNEVKQLTDMNLEMESVVAAHASDNDEVTTRQRKLEVAVREGRAKEKENKRLKNKVSALNKEVLSLNQTIGDLESLFNEHSSILVSKNKRIKHLGKQREAQQQSIHRLSSKLKKRERHVKGFLAAEESSFKKSHDAKNKRLEMLRQTNKKLVCKMEEAEKKILQMNGELREMKNQLKCECENRRVRTKALQVEISKLTADHNAIVMEKQEMQYERDAARKMKQELEAKMNAIRQEQICMISSISTSYGDVLQFLDSMAIEEDALYKFVARCRNTLLNTHCLTLKLSCQLIEGCDRAISVYFNSISYFKSFIDSCLSIKTKFENIEQTAAEKEHSFHRYELYQSALCSIYNIRNVCSSAAAATTASSPKFMLRSTRKILNPKNKDVIPKIPLIAKDLIRKPVQHETPTVPCAAYQQIYDALEKNIQNALKNLRKVTRNYEEPFAQIDEIYNSLQLDLDANEFEKEAHINWHTLDVDPATERVYPGAKQTNDERFEQIMNEFNQSSAQWRIEQTKKVMQLEGAWHQYDIATSTAANTPQHHAEKYLSPLTLKVSSLAVVASQGSGTKHSKRYSIF